MVASHLITSLVALLGLTLASPLINRQNSAPTLRDHASAAGKYIGTAHTSFYNANKKYSSILAAQFSQLTPENEMKWLTIHPERDTWNWTGCDLIFETAKENGQSVRGHTLVWNIVLPDYVTRTTNADELKALLTEHIQGVMGRYGSNLYAIDVVNEPVDWDGKMRPSIWQNVLGDDYIELALRLAHEAAPNVKLYINEFDIETIDHPKTTTMLALAKRLLAAGAPLHGIGFESHFVGGEVPADIAASMKLFTDLGLDVAITELDVRVPVDWRGVASSTWLETQAKDYEHVVQACLGNDRCPGVSVWGFTDLASWVPEVHRGWGAATLFDRNLDPKPAFNALVN